jgi:hypothetical protein
MSAVKKKRPVFTFEELPADETTADQRATYYALVHMLAEAKQPRDKAEMRKRITGLNEKVRMRASRLKVPYEQWDAECDRRLRAILTDRGAR